MLKVSDLPPQVRVIYDELVLIRRRGLTYHGMAVHGANIQQLPCVDAEHARSRGRRDRVSAAVDSVRCAIRRVMAVEDRTYLRYLLVEPEEGRQPSTVMDRQRAAERALGRPAEAFNENRSTVKMTIAHVELASELVRLESAPCQAPDTEAQVEELRLMFQETRDAVWRDLQRLGRLVLLGLEDEQKVREELLRQIAVTFPRGSAKVLVRARARPREGAGRFAEVLLEAILSERYPHQGEPFVTLSAAELRRMWRIAVTPVELEPTYLRAPHPRLSNAYETMRWNSIRVVDRLMIEEESSGWPILDDGTRIKVNV